MPSWIYCSCLYLEGVPISLSLEYRKKINWFTNSKQHPLLKCIVCAVFTGCFNTMLVFGAF